MQHLVERKTSQNLRYALARARFAWWVTAVALALIAAVTTAATTVPSLWVSAWLTGESGRLISGLPDFTTSPWSVVPITGLVVFAIAVVIAGGAAPTLLELARRVDKVLGQSQRMSTAYEVLGAGGPGDAVTRALLSDVEDRSVGLQVRRAAFPGGFSALSYMALAAIVAAVAATLVPVPERSVRDRAVTSSTDTVALPSADDIAAVAKLAEVLDLVAESAQNNYMRAVADSFAEFSGRLEAGALSGSEARSTSQEMARHLLAAAQEVGGVLQTTIESVLNGAATPNGLPPTETDERSDSSGAPLFPDGEAPPPPTEASPGASEAVATPSAYRAFDELVAEYEYDPRSLGLRPPSDGASDSGTENELYGVAVDAPTESSATTAQAPSAGRVQGEAGGEVAGAAQRSSERAGDAAGAGTAESRLGAAVPSVDEAMAGPTAALPHNERAGGDFTEVELLPSSSEPGSRLANTQDLRPDFDRSQESSSTIRGIGHSYSDVVASYFTPIAESAGAGQ